MVGQVAHIAAVLRMVDKAAEILAIVVLCLTLPGLSSAQQVQLGGALDSNLQLGSSGRNTSRAALQRLNPNLIITGNVTRGLSFQGYSPISSTTSFGLGSLSLPSATLSSFRRDSVGVGEFGSATALPASAQPFFYPSQTVLSVGHIGRGLNMPGSSVPANPYESLGKPIDGRATVKTPQRASYLTKPQRPQIPLPLSVESASRADSLNPLLARSSLFGPQPEIERLEELQRPVSAITVEQLSLLDQARRQLPSDTELSSGLPWEQDQGALAEDTYIEPLPTAPQPGLFESQITQQTTRQLAKPVSLLDLPTEEGEDKFGDMLAAVRFAEQFTETALPVLRERLDRHLADREQARRKDEAKRALRRRLVDDPRLQEPSLTPIERTRIEGEILGEYTSRWAAGVLTGPIDTFAGKKDSLLNKHLRQAEQLLVKGSYYLAAGHYDIAHAIDPDNPLPLLGKGHALLGAGEYRTSVRALLRGIARFPEIARFRLDLRRLLGTDQLLDIRRADLEGKLNQRDDHELRFLLGYIEYYSGLSRYGLNNLRRAAAEALPDSVIRRFVQLLEQSANVDPPSTRPAG